MYNKENVIRHQETRKCLNCGKEWTVWVTRKTNGARNLMFCDDCCKVLTNYQKKKIRFELDPEYYEEYKAAKRESNKRNIITSMIRRAKQRSEKCGYDFNLEPSDIVIPEICPILEVPLVLGEKDNYEYTPSLDRIDNSKGYIKGNIQVISKKANSMKNSATPKELQKFCKNILRYSLNNNENEVIESEDKEPQR